MESSGFRASSYDPKARAPRTCPLSLQGLRSTPRDTRTSTLSETTTFSRGRRAIPARPPRPKCNHPRKPQVREAMVFIKGPSYSRRNRGPDPTARISDLGHNRDLVASQHSTARTGASTRGRPPEGLNEATTYRWRNNARSGTRPSGRVRRATRITADDPLADPPPPYESVAPLPTSRRSPWSPPPTTAQKHLGECNRKPKL